ncbi:MAG: hypothetical protein IIV23_09175 [Ruminococcus sp.]|nr:hypothetical protein [Ruminococcus sp.]
MTPKQKKTALAGACSKLYLPCSHDEDCPICGVCTAFAHIADETACELYAEAVKRGAIKEEQ